MFSDFTPEGLKKIELFVNSELNPIKFLAIDPGKSNGVTGYDERYYLQFMMTVPSDSMTMYLEQFKYVKTCIYEGYRVYPGKQDSHVYSDLETPRVIGRMEAWAERKGIKLIKQGADIKPTAYKWLGKKALPKSNPRNHEWDAHAHFTFWAVKNEHIRAEELLKRSIPTQRT